MFASSNDAAETLRPCVGPLCRHSWPNERYTILADRTNDYKRHGVTSLFGAPDVATGNILGKRYRRHRSVELLDFLKRIDAAVAAGLDLHLVLDNYGTHKTALVRQWLQKRRRCHLHFTRQVKRGSHRSVQELEAAIRDLIAAHNQQPKPFRCTKAADQILASVAGLASSTVAAHHPTFYRRNQ